MPLFFIIMGISIMYTASSNAHFDPQVLNELSSTTFLPNEENHAHVHGKAKRSLQPKAITKGSDAITFAYKALSACVDVGAVVYATSMVYTRYTAVTPTLPLTKKSPILWWGALLPQPLQELVLQGNFFIDAGCIVVKTLAYKTVAKCLIACGTHDILDLAEDTVDRSKKIAKKIIT